MFFRRKKERQERLETVATGNAGTLSGIKKKTFLKN